MQSSSRLLKVATSFLVIFALGGLIWANYQFTRREQGGKDIAVYWSSARTLLVEGASPYGALASLRAEKTLYGLAGKSDSPPLHLDLPFHIEALFLPFGAISDFSFARALWMSLLEIAIVFTIFVSLRVLRWKTNPIIIAAIIFFFLFNLFGVWAIILGNAVVIAGLLLSLVLFALVENQDEFAGILLALATFKFFTVGFFILFILIWSAYQRRRRLFFPFVMTLVILVVLSFFFYPNWFLPYARAIYANLMHGDWISPAVILEISLPYVGEKIGWILSGAMAILLLVEWWLAMKKDFDKMIWTLMLTIAVTPLLGLPTYPQNFIVLILPLIFGFSVIANRWPSSSTMVICSLSGLLFLGLWALAILTENMQAALFFTLPIFTICMLYWIRWWYVKTARSQQRG